MERQNQTMSPVNKLFLFCVVLLAALSVPADGRAAALKTQNVFLIISDGFRWQEVFAGAEENLMNKENGGVRNVNALRQEFWRETPGERRRALLPFFWGTIATQGQLFGNQNSGSVVTVTNGRKFSYPGYNEILTGSGDPRIDSNDKRPNPNVTVFEWLNGRRPVRGHAAVLGTWEDFPYIFNVGRSHLPVWPAWERQFAGEEIKVPVPLQELTRDTSSLWNDLIYDSFLFQATMDCVKHQRPRLVFVGFGETDEWAHAGRYDLYLKAARHVDDFVQRLWETVQTMPQYRGKTTVILTADHGRGSGPSGWRDHGEKIAGAEGDWIAVIGPDTRPLGERTRTEPCTESQIAATIAALLGQDYRAAFPNAGAPIADVLGAHSK
jgi:hypothetical protein